MQVLCTAHRRRRHVVLSCNSPSSIVVLARLSLKFKSRSTRSANMFQNSCPVNWKSWNDPPAFVSHGQLPHKARIEQKAFMQWRASPPNELTFLGFSETRSTASMPLAHQSQCATTVCQREPRTLRPTCQCCQPPVALVDHSEMASPGSAQTQSFVRRAKGRVATELPNAQWSEWPTGATAGKAGRAWWYIHKTPCSRCVSSSQLSALVWFRSRCRSPSQSCSRLRCHPRRLV